MAFLLEPPLVRLMMPTPTQEGAVSSSTVQAGGTGGVEVDSGDQCWSEPRSATALVARHSTQQSLSDPPPRDPRCKSHRRLCHRRCRRLFCQSDASDQVAAVRYHRLLRRSYHLFDLLRRDRNALAGRPSHVGVRRRRYSRVRFCAHDTYGQEPRRAAQSLYGGAAGRAAIGAPGRAPHAFSKFNRRVLIVTGRERHRGRRSSPWPHKPAARRKHGVAAPAPDATRPFRGSSLPRVAARAPRRRVPI